MGSGGTYTSAIAMGGEPKTGKTELWDGTSWTEVTDMNTARQTLGGVATNNTSGMAIGGDESPPYTSAVELFTGAGADIGAWATGGNLNTGRRGLASVGADNEAALAFGGYAPGGNTETESYNGSSWTEVSGDLNSGRGNLAGAGDNLYCCACCGGIDNPGYLVKL